jgi:tetratricopeptide (TPR) repeat protein
VPDEWYRTADWSHADREDFEKRLARARAWTRPQYLRIKGLALRDAGDLEAAVSLWKRVIEEYPDSLDATSAFEHLGDVARRLGDSAEAERWYRALLDRSPSLSGTTGMVEVSLAELLIDEDDAGRCNAALELLESALHRRRHMMNDQLFRWHIALLRASEQLGETETQQRAARTALRLAERGPEFPHHKTVGVVNTDDDTLAWLRARASGHFADAVERDTDRRDARRRQP